MNMEYLIQGATTNCQYPPRHRTGFHNPHNLRPQPGVFHPLSSRGVGSHPGLRSCRAQCAGVLSPRHPAHVQG